MTPTRRLRRMAGFLCARLPDLDLENISEPRHRRGRRWPKVTLVKAALVGLMAGCHSLHEVEQLTAWLGSGGRAVLGIGRRVADTTLRDFLCRLNPDCLRAVLRRLIRGAQRRKALEPQGLPFGVVAIDGKSVMLPCWDERWSQKNTPHDHPPYGLLRTMTCCLVSARGRPCIDAVPIPPRTNEAGYFATCWRDLLEAYPKLFRLVTYDAGASSEANARLIIDAGKDYLFRLNDERRIMLRWARTLLENRQPVIETEEVQDNATIIVRRLSFARVYDHGNDYKESSIWPHTHTLLRLETHITRGQQTQHRERFFNTSLPWEALKPQQWLTVIRAHWGVENNNHHTLDTAFAEDGRRWITEDPQGALAVLLLRRVAYSLLTLFRSVTQRSDEARAIRWRDMMAWVYDTLIAATQQHLEGLRIRKQLVFG